MIDKKLGAKAYFAPDPDITTKAELIQRLRAQAKPDNHEHLVPKGPDADEVRRAANDMAQKRTEFLKTRLNTLRQSFANDHANALVKGKAKRGFERGSKF